MIHKHLFVWRLQCSRSYCMGESENCVYFEIVEFMIVSEPKVNELKHLNKNTLPQGEHLFDHSAAASAIFLYVKMICARCDPRTPSTPEQAFLNQTKLFLVKLRDIYKHTHTWLFFWYCFPRSHRMYHMYHLNNIIIIIVVEMRNWFSWGQN